MRAILAALALAALGATPAHAQTIEDPVARAMGGAIECIGPDTIARTCEAIFSYRIEDGQIFGDGVLHLQDNPTILIYGTSTLFMRDGLLCERVERATMEAARITVDGRPADPAIERQIKDAYWEAASAFREMCVRYTVEGAGAALTLYGDGVEQPAMADHLIWVRPEDGYTLGTADTSPT